MDRKRENEKMTIGAYRSIHARYGFCGEFFFVFSWGGGGGWWGRGGEGLRGRGRAEGAEGAEGC